MPSEPSRRSVPRRPVHFGPDAMEAHGGVHPGPAETIEAAHQSASALVTAGRANDDPDVTERLVHLVEDLGLAAVAELWSDRPAHSLPGALWRIYALREWIHRNPILASREYDAGVKFAMTHHVVAGVAEPPGPREVEAMADAILRGVFRGDFSVALHRAAAFCRIVAAGRADLEEEQTDPESLRRTQTAASLLTTADDLAAAAELWQRGNLV